MPDSDSIHPPPRAYPVGLVPKEDPFSAPWEPQSERSLFMRLWLATPDWAFRLLGITFFVWWLATQMHHYSDWNRLYQVHRNPWLFVNLIKLVLVHSTLLIVILAFIFRLPTKYRASRPREILLPLVGGFWPFLPFVIPNLLSWKWPEAAQSLNNFMWDNSRSVSIFLLGSALIIIGNAIDVWAYSKLFRSISIVAEARELKTTGPYRWIRHPIYLGHIIAQGGVWLFFARTHWVWIAYYLFFVCVQLYRSYVEDEVLERAFGERYLAYKRRTVWFF